jgi:hypothetical protein
MFPNISEDFGHDDDKRQLEQQAKSTDSFIYQDSFWDEDDYNDDGTLKSASDSYVDQEYTSWSVQTYSSSTGSASASWTGRFKKWGQDLLGSLSEEKKREKFFKRELSTITRAINSVRNFGSAGKTEQNIRVIWANSKQRNNIMDNSELYLSPDALDDKHTLRKEWSVDQRRDVVIGEAFTLLGMKRISNPNVAREITSQMIRDRERLESVSQLRGMSKDLPQLVNDDSEMVNDDLLRMLGCVMWRSVEQDAARAGILKDYRGTLPYFAAVQNYYSAPEIKEDIVNQIQHYLVDGLDDEERAGISIQVTRTLIWNMNHCYNTSEQVPIPMTTETGRVINESLGILKDAITKSDTAGRYNRCFDAALKVAALEPKQEQSGNGDDSSDEDGQGQQDGQGQPIQIPEELQQIWDKLNGDQKTGFDEIENLSDVRGHQDTNDVDDEITEGLSEASSDCMIIPKKKGNDHNLSSIRQQNRSLLHALRRKLEPCSERNVLAEHGLRSGKLSRNRLWKVGTELPDNDRIFHRNLQSGVSKQMTLVLLVDFSGSMNGLEINTAKRVGVLINDAMQDFPQIRFEVWGHEGSGSYNNIYHFETMEAFADQRCGGGTDEGGAYACVAKHIIKTSNMNDRKVIMALGDGDTNREVVSNAVSLAKRGGVETLNMLIGNDSCLENSEAAYGKGNVIVIGNRSWRRSESNDLETEILQIVQPWLVRTITKLQKQAI